MDRAGPESSARRPHKKRVVWTGMHGTGRVNGGGNTGDVATAQSRDSTPHSGGKRQEGPSGAFGEAAPWSPTLEREKLPDALSGPGGNSSLWQPRCPHGPGGNGSPRQPRCPHGVDRWGYNRTVLHLRSQEGTYMLVTSKITVATALRSE